MFVKGFVLITIILCTILICRLGSAKEVREVHIERVKTVQGIKKRSGEHNVRKEWPKSVRKKWSSSVQMLDLFPKSLRGHASFDLLGPVFSNVCEVSVYGKGDGSKRWCDAGVQSPCTVFSMGSANEWGFELDVLKRTDCEIHTFDCTVKLRPPKALATSSRFHAHELCWGRGYSDWGEILNVAGGTVPDFLKCDIEGWEFDAVPDMLESGLLPKQIAMEVHIRGGSYPPWKKKTDLPKGLLFALSEMLFYEGGYIIADRHDNPRCGHCSEILFYKHN